MLIKNDEIMDDLNEILDTIHSMPEKQFDRSKKPYSIDKEEACSEKYFNNMIEHNNKTFPNWGAPLHHLGSSLLNYYNDLEMSQYSAIKDQVRNLGLMINAKQNALISYYPNDGFIAWHHNADAPGRNFLFTWSETGDGFFHFRNPKTGADIKIPDKKGWSAKSLYYYGHGESEKSGYSWHCASTDCKRFTIAYIVGSRGKDMPPWWKDSLEDDFEIEEEYIVDDVYYL